MICVQRRAGIVARSADRTTRRRACRMGRYSAVESVEASGKSIEDAILQALVRLGRNRDEVDITVLQEPSRGSRGMGAREARVRVRLKPSRVAAQQPAPDEDEL